MKGANNEKTFRIFWLNLWPSVNIFKAEAKIEIHVEIFIDTKKKEFYSS